MSQPRTTLDQWNALVSVVEAGGYAQASTRLHRTQSTVTYTIKKLEDVLGVKVFELQGRKAVLTPIGEVLYRRGRALVDEARVIGYRELKLDTLDWMTDARRLYARLGFAECAPYYRNPLPGAVYMSLTL